MLKQPFNVKLKRAEYRKKYRETKDEFWLGMIKLLNYRYGKAVRK